MFLQCRKMPNPFRNNDLSADYILLMERLDPRRVCDSRGFNFPIADDSGVSDDNGPPRSRSGRPGCRWTADPRK